MFLLMRRPKTGILLSLSHVAHQDEHGVTLVGTSMVGKIEGSSVVVIDDGNCEMNSSLRRIEVGEERVKSTICLYHLVTVLEGRNDEFLRINSLYGMIVSLSPDIQSLKY